MSKIKRLISDDYDLIVDFGNDTDENGLYPGETRDILLDEIEIEKARREFELSKYSTQELKDELKRREPF